MDQYILKLQKKILNYNLKIKEYQDNCKHANVTKDHGANTGNYDLHNIYWTNFHCLDCDLRWKKQNMNIDE